jgi:GGDEF domain-containing protein
MKEKKKISTLNILLIVQLIIMIFVTLGITKVVASATRTNAKEHMKTLTDERAQIILSYVENAEKTLTYFSKGQQVRDLLLYNKTLDEDVDITKDPASEEIMARAQAYTQSFSAEIDNLEGLWIGDWNSHCISHTSDTVVGLTTRKDPESLNQLRTALTAAGEGGVYNAGMIISPATNKQIVSMYKPVYNDQKEPIGFVGLGIFTNELVSNLNELKIKGMEHSTYSMINIKDTKYVFHQNPEMIGEITLNKQIGKICSGISSGNTVHEGDFTYKGDDGVTYVSTYTYIPKYGWLLVLDDPKTEAYSLARLMRVYTAVFGIIVIALMLIFYFVNKRQEKVNQKLASTIAKSNKTKDSLYTAMFKDVLTDVSNRIAFSMDVEEANTPHYFAMFNICDFSNINISYGNDTGDWLLVRTVDILKQVFKKGKIYRTGSDEFIVSVEAGEGVETNTVMEDVKDAYRRLTALQNTPVGKLNFAYRSAVVKKSKNINTSVVAVLKDMLNKNTVSGIKDVSFNDIDAME